MRTTAFLLGLGLLLAPATPLRADEGPTDKEPAPEDGAESEPKEIPFLSSIEEGQAKAKEAKKGLFVYLTPSWFT